VAGSCMERKKKKKKENHCAVQQCGLVQFDHASACSCTHCPGAVLSCRWPPMP
jgi:hypothetical protein